MNILYIISRPLEINTSASIRNRATISGLINNGHKVTLLTTAPDKKHENYDKNLGKIKGLNTRYIHLKGEDNIAKLLRGYNFLKRIKNIIYKIYSSYNIYDNLKSMVNYIDEVKVENKEYDLIISSSDPKSSHLFASKLIENKELKNTPWLQIWGDPFAADITKTSHYGNIKREEERLLTLASKIMYVSKFSFDEQKKLYEENAEKMFWLPVPYEKEKKYGEKINSHESLTFLYAGDYSSNIRNILPLYEAFKNSHHKLVICGGSNLSLRSTKNITVHSRLTQEEVEDLSTKSDVLVHLSNNRGHQIPAKVYHYSSTDKPILFILDGNMQRLFKYFDQFNRYVFAENNLKSLTSVIHNFYRKNSKVENRPVKKFHSQIVAYEMIKNIVEGELL